MNVASWVALLTFVPALAAQQVASLSVNVNVVSILATVHDRDGKLVNNLTAGDFVLEEDGVPQKIRYFSRESDLPLTVGLLVDTSRSQQGVLEQESKASSTFFDQVLHPGKDEAFVMKFDTRVETLQGLTSSRQQLAAALDRLVIPEEYATLLYSAVRQSSEDILQKREGRKALILLTDGVAYRDDTSVGTAIECAQRADTILYSIRFSDAVRAYRPVRAAFLSAAKEHGKLELERMAKQTGGESFGVTSKQSIDATYQEIEEALRSQYSAGYTPARTGPDGKYHRIKLVTKDKHLTVDASDGYFAK
jgi:VWFA-related protein